MGFLHLRRTDDFRHPDIDSPSIRDYLILMTTNTAPAAEHPGLTITTPYDLDGTLKRYQCNECGAWGADTEKANGEILHGKRCDSKPQPAKFAALFAARAAKARELELVKFARRVKATGQTYGRDQDVRDAVAAGLLSQGDAMNSDD